MPWFQAPSGNWWFLSQELLDDDANTNPYKEKRMKISMLNDRVLLKLKEGSDKTKSGLLYIPDTGKDAPQIGVVVAANPGRRLEDGSILPCIVSEGDQVIFGKYSGSEVEIDGEKYLSILEGDLHAKVAEEDSSLESSTERSESPASTPPTPPVETLHGLYSLTEGDI